MSLVLYYDTLWGNPLSPNAKPLPGFEISTDRRRYAQARAVVFHIPAWRWKPRFLFPRKLPHQIWVAWSMECEENYPRLKDPDFMRAFDLTMLYRLDSNIPVPYFSFYSSAAELFAALRAPVAAKTASAPVASFVSSRINRSGRREYLRELMQYMPTDSYGKYLNNARIPDDRGRSSKLQTLTRYKFNLGFENAIGRDYVTEKFFDPLVAGTVPIYRGAPNIEAFAPGEHCYINVNDYPEPRALADYLQFLLQNEDAYNAYFAWKQKPLRPVFVERVQNSETHPATRLCEWLQKNVPDRG